MYLHLNVQDANPALLCDTFDSFNACSISVIAKFCMFDETFLLDQIQEFLLGHKVVFFAMLFTPSRATGRVRDAEAEFVGILDKEALQNGGFART